MYKKAVICNTFNDSHFDPSKAQGVESVLNAVTLANGSSWETEFKSFLNEVTNLYLMPDDKKCVKAYLKANSFIHQPGISQAVYLDDVISLMDWYCHDGQEAIVSLYGSPTDYILISSDVSADPVSGSSKYRAYGFRKLEYRQDIVDIWVRWKDHQDHSPVKRRKGRTKEVKPRKEPASHEFFHYHQKNPKEFTGDCVIRAIASVCDLTWADTIHSIAEKTGYQSTTLNVSSVYENYLLQMGFKPRPAMVQKGHRLRAPEFCRELDKVLLQGQVVFAHVGKCHVAAVLPFTENGITHYKIVDSWDSTKRAIGEYWIKDKSPLTAYTEALHSCHEGAMIVHPVFGVGRVLSLNASGWATIQFETHGKRNLDTKWVLQNCICESRPANFS